MGNTFTADLTRFCKKYDADMKLVIRKISFEAFKRVVLRTPVDTGRARANWALTAARPTTYQIESGDKSGAATLRQIQDGTMIWECQGSLFLSNNLPYIGVLEFGGYPNPPKNGTKSSGGFSKQAPTGMVRVTVAEMKAWIEGNAKKATIGSIKETGR